MSTLDQKQDPQTYRTYVEESHEDELIEFYSEKNPFNLTHYSSVGTAIKKMDIELRENKALEKMLDVLSVRHLVRD